MDEGRFMWRADQFAVEWNESKHASVLARAAEASSASQPPCSASKGSPATAADGLLRRSRDRPRGARSPRPRRRRSNERYRSRRRHRQIERAGGLPLRTPSRKHRQDVQTPCHLRRHGPRKAPHAGDRACRDPEQSGDPAAILRRRAVINEVIESIHAAPCPSTEALPQRRRSLPGGRRAFLEGKEMTQEEFFQPSTPCSKPQTNVLTSDRPPKEIGLEDRLISVRVGDGGGIGHPDWSIGSRSCGKRRAGSSRADDTGRRAPLHRRTRAVERARARRLYHQVAAVRVAQESRGHDRAAREALSERSQGEDGASYADQPTPSIDRVQEVVARRWGVTPEGLRSKVRTKTLTIPRQVAMYLARNMLGMQLVEIGQAFGGRDHSTVIHSVDKVERQMIRDRTSKSASRWRGELSALSAHVRNGM